MCRNRQKSKVHERLPCQIVYGITNLNFCRWMMLSVSDTGLVGWLCTVYLASEQGADFLVTGRPPKTSFSKSQSISSSFPSVAACSSCQRCCSPSSNGKTNEAKSRQKNLQDWSPLTSIQQHLYEKYSLKEYMVIQNQKQN